MAYPDDLPGWKGSKSTGREAALAIAPTLKGRRAAVWNALARFGAAGATCDDICDSLGLPVYLVRPRATELEKLGKLFAIGKRNGAAGHKVTIYSTVRPDAMKAAA